MTSYMIGFSPSCQISQFGLEARVSPHGETGAGLMELPGATPTGQIANPRKMIWEWVMKIVLPSTTGGMD